MLEGDYLWVNMIFRGNKFRSDIGSKLLHVNVDWTTPQTVLLVKQATVNKKAKSPSLSLEPPNESKKKTLPRLCLKGVSYRHIKGYAPSLGKVKRGVNSAIEILLPEQKSVSP